MSKRYTQKIRKAVIPAAPVVRLLAPVVYIHASQERDYGAGRLWGLVVN